MSESKSNDYLGLQLTLSQHDLVASKVAPESQGNQVWQYDVFGRFDRLRIEVVENVTEFYKNMSNVLSNLDTDDGRKNFLPETQKLFFFSKGEGREGKLKNQRLREYATKKEANGHEKQGKPFIGLVAVKLRSSSPGRLKICSIPSYKCIEEKIADEIKKSDCGDFGIEFFILQSLGIDDIYVLFGMDSPDYARILKLAHALEKWNCKFECEHSIQLGKEATKLEFMKKAADMLKPLEEQYLSPEEKSSKTIQLITNVRKTIEKQLEIEQIPENIEEGILKEVLDYWKICREKCEQPMPSETSFFLLSRLLDCIDIVRACDSAPIVLRSHTIVGYTTSAGLNEIVEKIPYDNPKKLHLRISLTLRPGASVNKILETIITKIDEINKENEMPEEKELPSKIYVTVGRDDYRWECNVSSKELLQIVTKLMSNAAPLEGVLDFSSTLSLADAVSLSDDAEDKLKQQIFDEDIALAKRWQKEQLKNATDFFKNIIRSCDKYPIKSVLEEMSLLHIQGCLRFFLAFAWSEFQDARGFFGCLYEELEKIFNDIDIEKYLHDSNKDEKYERLRKNLEMCLRKMSPMFHERIVLDKSMRENTRPGLYATGAYEKLLKRYSCLVRKISGILAEVEKQDEKSRLERVRKGFGFILLPLSNDTIHTHHLFEWRTKADMRFVVYETPLECMLDFKNAFPLFAHEAGHYWGTIGREFRTKVFLEMVSAFFCTTRSK